MGDEGVVALAHALSAVADGHDGLRAETTMRRLCLGCNPIGDRGCAALTVALLTPPLSALAILQLGDTDVGDVGAGALADALGKGAMAHGIQLWLASTRITHAGRGRIMMAASEREMRICW